MSAVLSAGSRTPRHRVRSGGGCGGRSGTAAVESVAEAATEAAEGPLIAAAVPAALRSLLHAWMSKVTVAA